MDPLVQTQRRVVIGLIVLGALFVALGSLTPRFEHTRLAVIVAVAMLPGALLAGRMTVRASIIWMAWTASLLTVFFLTGVHRAQVIVPLFSKMPERNPVQTDWTYMPMAFVVMAMFVAFLLLGALCHQAAQLAKQLPVVPEARVRR